MKNVKPEQSTGLLHRTINVYALSLIHSLLFVSLRVAVKKSQLMIDLRLLKD